MSPSLDQDNSNSPPKSNSKATAAGFQTSTKGKKNGTTKNGTENGVLGAVLKKNASKNPASKSTGTSIPNRFPSAATDMKPGASGSDGSANPGATSPLLDTLPVEAPVKPSMQATSEWLAKSSVSTSPSNNLINLGESPPTLPSSYEDRLANFGWNIREQRGIPSPNPISTSPPGHRRRPISYHNAESIHQQAEDHQSQVSSYAGRRRSMASPYPQYNTNPPLPHQIQPHFYGIGDTSTLRAARGKSHHGYYCGFDQWRGDNVVVSGYEGGLDLYAVTKRGLQRTLRLLGLRGGVYNTKILPGHSGRRHLQQSLIVVVVHGPARMSSDTSSGEYTNAHTEDVSSGQAESARQQPRVRSPSALEQENPIESYQTTVEVFSLETKEHITTLLSLPKVPVNHPMNGPQVKPSPTGSLTIRADTNSVVLSSGVTGEIWIYKQVNVNLNTSLVGTFKCIGKLWTTVQHGHAVNSDLSGQNDGEWTSTETAMKQQPPRAPILSLNGRWLAYCPSTPSSQVSIRAVVHGSNPTARAPGLNGQAPPQLPPINCEVETPGGESVMKQVAQVITQRVAEGATFLGKQGVQVWNNYWNKPSSNQPHSGVQYQAQASMAHQFPPTHGAPNQAPPVSKEPGLISIIDLETLAQHPSSNGPPHPFATFRVTHGCSFISFAPSGLALFTASSKGDVQFVWDLMRVHYARPSFLKAGSQTLGRNGGHVRQIAQFSRMTITRIVDVVWTSPHGERAAMVTEPGTVHILDLPASAFTWPPLRRRIVEQKPDDEVPGPAQFAAGVASNAVSSLSSTLWTAAKPLVSRQRRSSTSVSAISASSVKSQAGQGTQALAAGISRSVGAATGRMNEMRKSGTTKLHLPRNSSVPTRACIGLYNGKKGDTVLVLGGGVVGLYTVKGRQADRPADKQKASRGAKYVEFRIPALPDFPFSPDPLRDLHQADFDFPAADLEPHRPKHRQLGSDQFAKPRGTESSIPQAEIESNAPYQPFHTDRRVGLHIYSQNVESGSSPSVSTLLTPERKMEISLPAKSNVPWAFGSSIRTTQLDVGPQQNTEDSFYAPDHRALPSSAIERVMKVTDNNQDTESIMVTTRIRRSARSGGENNGDLDEEGFFEDDCEVLDFASQRV